MPGRKEDFLLLSPRDSQGWAVVETPAFLPSGVSLRTGCPVRCMLDRDEDMLITGGRHPFLARYKVPDVGRCARAGSAISLEGTLTFLMTICRRSKKE